MNKETMEALSRGAASLDIPLGKRDEYRGKGMLMATCAVVVKSAGYFAAAAAAGGAEMGQDHLLIDEYLEDLKDMRFDSMGAELVAY